jgi:hypothetical protein
MNRKQIVIALSAAALSVSVVAANAASFVHYGDENNLDWVPAARTSAPVTHNQVQESGSNQFVHYGDENNLDWLPTPAKR